MNNMMKNKLKLIGFLSLTINNEYAQGANKVKKPNSPVKENNEDKKTKQNKKVTQTSLIQEIVFNKKDISFLMKEVLRHLGKLEIYNVKQTLITILDTMMSNMKEELRKKDPNLTDEAINANLSIFETQKEEMLKNLDNSKDEELVKVFEKYNGIIQNSKMTARIVSLIVIIQSLQETESKLKSKIHKLKEEYVHKLHKNSMALFEATGKITYLIIMSQQQKQANMDNQELNKDLDALATQINNHRLITVNAIIGLLKDLKKILIEQEGEDSKIINSNELNYVKIDNNTYGILLLIDSIIHMIEEIYNNMKNNPSTNIMNANIELDTIIMWVNSFVISQINKDKI
jgi:hypothetical protein